MFQVTLDYPPAELNPNRRLHWAARYRIQQAAKRSAFFLTLEAVGGSPIAFPDGGRIPIHLEFRPPDRRRRDQDNAIASMKPLLDAVAAALGVDDSRFDLSHSFGDPVRPARVLLTIGLANGEAIGAKDDIEIPAGANRPGRENGAVGSNLGELDGRRRSRGRRIRRV